MSDGATGGVRRPVVVAVLGLLALALLAVVAGSGPVDLVSEPAGGGVAAPTPSTATSSPTATPQSSDPPSVTAHSITIPPVVSVVLHAVALAIGLVALVLLLRFIRRHAARMHTRVADRRGIATLPDVLPDELTERADARMALLQSGTPRNAIVACWLDLEETSALVGLPREPAETSVEYTRRVLLTWDVSPDALGRLGALFREARFSRHELTEEDRAAAGRELGRLHADLQRVADELAAARELAEAEQSVRLAELAKDRAHGASTPGRA